MFKFNDVNMFVIAVNINLRWRLKDISKISMQQTFESKVLTNFMKVISSCCKQFVQLDSCLSFIFRITRCSDLIVALRSS